MIVKFNPNIFDTEDDQSLTAIFDLFYSYFNDSFLWDLENIEELFLTEEGEFKFENHFTATYLAPRHFEKLEDKVFEAIDRAVYNTKIHYKYLRSITIGNGQGEISASDALLLIKNPSYLVVENGTNDGKFLEGLILNYAKYGKRSSIYSLIHEAYVARRLRPSNAGGGGGLKGTAESLMAQDFEGHGELKLFVFFDSDRRDNGAIHEKYNNLMSFLKGRQFDRMDSNEWVYQNHDKYLWHMSYKREQENYVPLPKMFQTFTTIDANTQRELTDGSDDFRDFFDFGNVLTEGDKNITPTLFLVNGQASALENKCSHHMVSIELHNGTLESVSEIEDILLKIAKII